MKALHTPFQLDPKGGIAQAKSYDEIVRSQVVDALMTNQGERVFRPRYGCDVQSALFDPVDELVRRDAASFIMRRLEQFVPRATVRFVTVDRSLPEPNTVIVSVTYRANLLSPDQVVEIPVSSSEFITRQTQRELRESNPFSEEVPA